ncbi:hypothetical protein [Streptomyces sp. NPDC006355]|uniref:hypothetical protein n=1 Tax=Streptomyces sp. NPDC006355 TaxID=3156758 RepID=UPI0033B07F31
MIPYLVLTAALTGSAGWILGHRTARIRVAVIGATPQQDAAAIADAHEAYMAHVRRRFDEMVARLDLDTPDQEQP